MFADKPNSFLDDLKKFPEYWKNVTSPVLEDLQELSRTRLIYDGCNAGVKVGDGGVLNFYRNKYCNPGLPVEPNEPILQKKTPPMPQDYCGNLQFTVGVQADFYSYQDNINGRWYLIQEKIRVTKIIYPLSNGMAYIEATKQTKFNYSKEYADYQGYVYPPVNPEFTTTVLKGQTVNYSGGIYSITNGSPIIGQGFFGIDTFNSAYSYFYGSGGFNTYQEYNTTDGVFAYTLPNPDSPPPRIIVTPARTLTGDIQQLEDPLYGKYYQYTALSLNVYRSNYGFYTTCGNYNPIPDPPPPPKKEECCKMDCCPDNSKLELYLKLLLKRIGTPQKVTIFDEDLDRKGTQKADKTPQSLNEYLKLTTERVEIVNRLLGIDNYPLTVPDTMITPFQEGVFAKVFKFIDGKKKRKINSITELIAWMSEQDSAVLGEFHQVIQFETEDKKASSVVLPNVAEALKEIVLLTSQMARQNNTQTELIFKIAAEVTATKAVASKGTEIAQDIQDYLDYPTETKTKTIPSAISLPKLTTNKQGQLLATSRSEDPQRFLKPGEIKIVYEDWTGKNSLHDQLLDLLQLAAMLRAIYFQRTDK